MQKAPEADRSTGTDMRIPPGVVLSSRNDEIKKAVKQCSCPKTSFSSVLPQAPSPVLYKEREAVQRRGCDPACFAPHITDLRSDDRLSPTSRQQPRERGMLMNNKACVNKSAGAKLSEGTAFIFYNRGQKSINCSCASQQTASSLCWL